MRSQLPRGVGAAALVLLLGVSACGGPSGVTGPRNQWLKGKSVSVNVGVATTGITESPYFNVRNDSSQPFTLSPIKVTVWYKKAGKMEREVVIEPEGSIRFLSKETSILSARVETPPILNPQKETSLGVGLWVFDTPQFDQVEKVRVALGPGEQEIFTVKI
jgi:hypothetical protein